MHRPIALGLAIGAVLLLLLDAVATRAGLSTSAIPTLAGTSLWITSRAAGVTAFLALTLDVAFGLSVSTGALDRFVPRAASVDAHRRLSSVTLTMVGVHGLALLGDRFVRFDVLDLLLPFVSSYRSFGVGLGVLAAHGALLVHASFSWRSRLGAKTWRKLHYASFLVFVAALLHGILAGSDSARPGMRALYALSALIVAALGAYRALKQRGAPVASGRSGGAT